MKNLKLFLTLAILCCVSPFFAQQDFIYVSDAGGFNVQPWQIMRYDIDGSNPLVFIDNDFFVNNNVGWPQDIVFLEDENEVLISCLVGNRITRHNASTGEYIDDFAAIAGGPTRMKIHPTDGYLYVLQWSNSVNKVLRYELDGTFVDEFTETGVQQSIGIDWDMGGGLYVTSYGNGIVQKFNPSGTDAGEFIDTVELQGPTNILQLDNFNWVVLDWTAGDAELYDPQGNYIDKFTTGLSQPEGIAVDDQGNLLIGNGGTGSVKKYDSDGNFIEDVVASGAGGLMQPNAVVIREDIIIAGLEDAELKKVKVAPTMGNEFRIRTENAPIKSIEVIGMDGKKITNLPLSENLVWNASSFAEGIYFLVFTLENNKKATRKVVVKR